MPWPFISVNISSRQFAHPEFTSILQSLVNDLGLSPSRLKLEIPESVLMENWEVAFKTMSTVKSLGFELYMDDFGTGLLLFKTH